MTQLVPFDFQGSPVRTIVDRAGDVWFVARDVVSTLGYSNPSKAIQDHCKDAVTSRYPIRDSLNREQYPTLIPESDVYRLILRSKLPAAERFEEWVIGEVLPTIRKTGAYVAPGAKIGDTLEAAKLFEPMFNIARLIGCDTNAAAISANQAVQAVAGPNLLALMGQTHMEAANQESLYFTPTELGKRIGVSARRMNVLLEEAGLQVKCGEHWEATEAGRSRSRIYDTGKQRSSGVPIQQVKWSADVLPAITGQQAA